MIAVAAPLTEAEWLTTTCGMLDAEGWSWIHYTPTRRAETLYTVGTTGLDGTALNRVFGGNSVRAARARDEAVRLSIAVEETDKTGRGRPRKSCTPTITGRGPHRDRDTV